MTCNKKTFLKLILPALILVGILVFGELIRLQNIKKTQKKKY